jgi:transposase
MALAAATHSRDLTDEQWDLIGRFLPELVRREDRRGRPWRENREVLNGILWILRTGAPLGLTCRTAIRRINLPPAVSAVGPRRRAA